MTNPDFDVYVTLGIIIKGRVDSLKDLIAQIEEDDKYRLIFTKTSAGRLTIVDEGDS